MLRSSSISNGSNTRIPAGEVVPDAFLAAARLGAASGAKRSPFGFGVVDAVGPHQQALGEHGQVGQGVRPEVGAVHGDGPPAGQFEPFGGAGFCDRGFGGLAGDVVVEVQEREHHPEAVLVELPPDRRRADPGEEGPGERREDAGPVAREPVGRDRGAVADAGQPGEGELDDRARPVAGDIGDESDAAPVEFGHAQTLLMGGHGLLAGLHTVPRGRGIQGPARRPVPEPSWNRGSSWGDTGVATRIVPDGISAAGLFGPVGPPSLRGACGWGRTRPWTRPRR
jgi:hypothetical protein